MGAAALALEAFGESGLVAALIVVALVLAVAYLIRRL